MLLLQILISSSFLVYSSQATGLLLDLFFKGHGEKSLEAPQHHHHYYPPGYIGPIGGHPHESEEKHGLGDLLSGLLSKLLGLGKKQRGFDDANTEHHFHTYEYGTPIYREITPIIRKPIAPVAPVALPSSYYRQSSLSPVYGAPALTANHMKFTTKFQHPEGYDYTPNANYIIKKPAIEQPTVEQAFGKTFNHIMNGAYNWMKNTISGSSKLSAMGSNGLASVIDHKS